MNTDMNTLASKLMIIIAALVHQTASATSVSVANTAYTSTFNHIGITAILMVGGLLLYQFWRFYQRVQRREADIRQ